MSPHSADVRRHRGGGESSGLVLLRGEPVDEESACCRYRAGTALTQMLADLRGDHVAAALRTADDPLRLNRICDVANMQSGDCGQAGTDLDHQDARTRVEFSHHAGVRGPVRPGADNEHVDVRRDRLTTSWTDEDRAGHCGRV